MGLTSKAFTKVTVSGSITSNKESAVSLKVTPIGGESATTRMFYVRSTIEAGAAAAWATTWWGFTEEAVNISTVSRHSSAARWNVSISVCFQRQSVICCSFINISLLYSVEFE